MSWFGSLWPRFRALPVWAQVATWSLAWVVWPVPLALYAASRPPVARRRWWSVTAAATLAWAGIAALSPAGDPSRIEQPGRVEAKGTTTTAPGASTSTTAAADGGPGSPDGTTTTAPPAGSTSSTATSGSSTTSGPSPAPGPGTAPTTTATTRPPPPPSSPSGGGVALLARLRVAPEGVRSGYNRDLFSHWIDADGDRCDTREEVLIAESRTPAQIDPYGCKVVAGDWFSIYDGVTTDQPGELDIDHVVALAEAWDSGASAWDPTRRRDFANDLGYDGSLIAVTAGSNRSKSDEDPAGWLPPRREAWCTFATDWVTVKIRWDLTADEPEVAALRTALGTCNGAPTPPASAWTRAPR